MRLGALLLACALALMACGSQGSEGSGSDSGSGESSPELPGGTAGEDVLAEHGFLSDDGQVGFAEGPPPEEVQPAFCDYLFGEPDEVAEVAELEGTVSLNEDSGFRNAGGSGIGFRCAYDVSDETTLALVLWTQDTADADDEGEHVVTVKLREDLYGYSGYAPGYDGPSMSASTAKAWLTEAGERVAGL
jgi:hypothetical protein